MCTFLVTVLALFAWCPYIGEEDGAHGAPHTGADTMNNDTITAACPKCIGTGHIRAFSHIDNGTCFACSGSGVASVCASSADGGGRRSRLVLTEAFGAVEVYRHGAGFQADFATGAAWFDLVGGQVRNVTLSDHSHWVGNTEEAFRATMQEAHDDHRAGRSFR